MTSAGFNPGGGAAAMARMGYYLTYVTQDLTEYQDPTQKDLPQDDFSDHPATERREAKLAGFMTDYSAGHVTVIDRKTICIDGTPLLTVTWTNEDYDNSPENAYLTAGALARAFHDYDRAEDWNLALTRDGGATLGDDSRVNELLVHAHRCQARALRRVPSGMHRAHRVPAPQFPMRRSPPRVQVEGQCTLPPSVQQEVPLFFSASFTSFLESSRTQHSESFLDFAESKTAPMWQPRENQYC